MISNQATGSKGEALAQEFLKAEGYEILTTNHRTRYGEIDVIARHENVICFIEVKMRNVIEQGHPLEAITSAKMRSLSKAALSYLQTNQLWNNEARFDVVAIIVKMEDYQIELVKNAFELSY